MSVFYHVTFASRVPAIQKEGLVTGKRRIWSNSFGAKLGKQAIYLFTTPTQAVRWAHKMQYEFNRKTVILVIDNPPGNIVADDHIEAQMAGGNSWFHTDESIPPVCIKKVIPLTLELTRKLVKDGEVSLDEEIIEEGRDAALYHAMSYVKAISVLDGDNMPARWEHTVRGMGKVLGNSLSRNRRNYFADSERHPVLLLIDQAKLSHNHKIVPLDGERAMHASLNPEHNFAGRDRVMNARHDTSLSEEFVIGDIPALHNYLTGIELSLSHSLSPYETIELYEHCAAYCEKWSIPLVVGPKYLKHMQDTKQRWEDEELEEAFIDPSELE